MRLTIVVALTALSLVMLFAGTASAQVTLPVADAGSVVLYQYAYGGPPVGSVYFTRTIGLAGNRTSLFYYTYLYHNQAVAVLSLSTGMPSAGSAPLSVSASSINGTWTLWAKLGDGTDSVVDTGDYVGGTGSFSSVGQFSTTATGSGTFGFNIRDFLNADLAAGNSFSTYVLTHPGTNNQSTVGLITPVQYTPVPEPGTLALFGLGLVTFAAGYRIRRRKKA